jgi:hypothetical protein
MTRSPRGSLACENMNHRRANSPVSHCPQCGGVVNPSIVAGRCDEAKHAASRRRQSTFCVDCGVQLIVAR